MGEPACPSVLGWDGEVQPAICAHSGWGREELVLQPNTEVHDSV